jgi:hypothetical protein
MHLGGILDQGSTCEVERMAKGPFGKGIRAKEARKLIKEVGGAKDAELKAEIERILGHSSGSSNKIYRLTDCRVVDISHSNARLYESTEEFRQFLASVEETARRSTRLGRAFPAGAASLMRLGNWPRRSQPSCSWMLRS